MCRLILLTEMEQVLRQCYFLMAICFCTDSCTVKDTLSFLDTGKW
jgi:hypothetical protein